MDVFNITQVQSEDLLLQRDPTETIRAVKDADSPRDLDRLKDAAKRFEGLFVHQILKQMKETAEQLEPEEDEESGDRSSSEHIKNMFWTFLGDAVTRQGGFGLWEQIYRQMTSSAESGPAPDLAELDERI